MADPADDTTTLNPGAGGAVMDVSNVLADDGTPSDLLRERVVIGGELNRDTIAEVTQQSPYESAYGLPVRGIQDPAMLAVLQGIHSELQRIRILFEMLMSTHEGS